MVQIGKQLSHFKILSKLGEGGMGVVYRAEDENLGRHVAVKVLPPEMVESEERRLRFIREARLAAAVAHPNIATIHEIDEDDGVVFIAMELVEGKSLKDLLVGEPLELQRALRIAVMITDGLCGAHKEKIVHRDLKPENIMIGPDGHLKILDFGLAKPYGAPFATEGDDQPRTISAGMTRDGRILGTVAYMSPEQARGMSLDFRSDIFSLGILVYEMVTAKSPFKGETVTDTLSAILRDHQPPIARYNPGAPAELERILNRCMEKEPEHRYGTTEELLEELRNLKRVSDSDSLPRVSLSGERTRKSHWLRPLLLGLAGAAVLAIGILVSGLLDRDPLPPVEPLANSLAVLPFEQLQGGDETARLGQIMQELIITDLSGGSDMRVFSSQRLFDIQKQLGRGKKTTIDRDMASAVAAQAGATTMLTGTLANLDDRWILTSNLVDVSDGTVIKSERLDGTDLYGMVDQLTPLIRRDLGLARTNGAELDVAVKERTTDSIEAYDRFLAGAEALNNLDWAEAVQELEQAVAIDPSFGRARYKLAIARWWNREGKADPEQGAEGPGDELEVLLSNDYKLSTKERDLAEASLVLVEERYKEARPLFERLTEKYPDEKEAWYGLGEAAFHGPEGRESKQALVAFETAIELDPSFRLAYFHVLEQYERQNRYEEGRAKVRSLMDHDPGNPRWHVEYARLTAAGGDESEIEQVVTECMEQLPDVEDQNKLLATVADTLGERGALLRRDSLLSAAAAGQKPAELETELVQTLGWNALEMGRSDEAEQWFFELENRDRELDALRGLIRLRLVQQDHSAAKRYSQRLADADAHTLQAFVAMLEAAVHTGHLEQADELLEGALGGEERGDEERWSILLQSSEVFNGAGEFARGEASILRARKLLPERAPEAIGFFLGWSMLGQGRDEEAESMLVKLHHDQPGYLPVTAALSVCWLKMGRYTEVERLVRDSLSRGPEVAFLLRLLSVAVAEQGRYAEAEKYASRAVEMDRTRTSYALLSWALVAGELDLERGIEMAQRALSRPRELQHGAWNWPALPSAEHSLGLAYLKLGRYDDAIRQLREAAEVRPDRELIREHLDEARSKQATASSG